MKMILLILILLVWLKTITGFRFPWETCDCCGKKIRERKKNGEQL